MIICLLGKSGAGKDTLLKKIRLSKPELRPVVSYTTRPIRENEVNGLDYNFLSLDEFNEKIKSGDIIEHRVYNTTQGDWYYGSPKLDEKNDYIQVIELQGYNFIKEYYEGKHSIFGLYLNVPENIRLQRLQKRGDNIDEINRRLETDNNDFKNISTEPVKTFKEFLKNYYLESIV